MNKTHIYIAIVCLTLIILVAGHGILTVWMAQVKVSQYEAQTKRLDFLNYACNKYDIDEGHKRAFIIDGETIKCTDSVIDYVPSKEKVSFL